jgi:hypothetical protein
MKTNYAFRILGAIGVVIVAVLGYQMYQAFGRQVQSESTCTAHVSSIETRVDADGRIAARLELTTASGDIIPIRGKMAGDMVFGGIRNNEQEVGITYETLAQYDRAGQLRAKYHRVKQWWRPEPDRGWHH